MPRHANANAEKMDIFDGLLCTMDFDVTSRDSSDNLLRKPTATHVCNDLLSSSRRLSRDASRIRTHAWLTGAWMWSTYTSSRVVL
jgi:hypothetical protein